MKIRRTMRGRLSAGETRRLIVDDGRFTDGWVVESFSVVSTDPGTSADPHMVLCIDEGGMTGNWDFADNRQIAWAFMSSEVGTGAGQSITYGSWVSEHVVVTDLFIQDFSTSGGNYIITIRRQELTEDEAILALIKERAQDDL
jgi:hypothetical protein